MVDQPRKEWKLRYALAAGPPSTDVVATMSGAEVVRDDFRLGPVDLTLVRGDRVALGGDNGSGKSTLIGALLGSVRLTAGRRSLGGRVRVGILDQQRTVFDADETVVDVVRRELDGIERGEVRTLLAKFGLTAEHVLRPAASLSPGERTRAALALLQAREVNLLVLDEPTNHLDLPAIEQLESALDAYTGTLLLVTHDRRMLEAVHTTRRVEVADGKVVEIS